MLLVLSVYIIYWRETRQYQRNVHLIIQLKPSNPGKRFIEMQLVHLNDIFEDNQNIVCDRFERNSVNLMKNRLLVAKNTRKFQCILTCSRHIVNHGNLHQEQQHSNRLLAILVCDKLLRNMMNWKSIGLILMLIYNDVIKSS